MVKTSQNAINMQKRSYLTIQDRISAVNVWPTHFQHSGQPDAKTAEAFILQLEGEYH